MLSPFTLVLVHPVVLDHGHLLANDIDPLVMDTPIDDVVDREILIQ